MSYLNNEELQLASRFLFLSMAIIVIQKDIQYIRKGTFKIKEPYLELLTKMSSKGINERRHLRKKMQARNVQVVLISRNDLFSTYLFLCGGREEERNYFNPIIRKKVENIVRELMKKSLPPYSANSSHASF